MENDRGKRILDFTEQRCKFCAEKLPAEPAVLQPPFESSALAAPESELRQRGDEPGWKCGTCGIFRTRRAVSQDTPAPNRRFETVRYPLSGWCRFNVVP